MHKQDRREEIDVTVGGDKFPAFRCDCGRVFLQRSAFLVHRARCSDFEGADEKPRRIRERDPIKLEGRVNSGGADEPP